MPAEFLVPYFGANVIAVLLLATAYKWPRVSRVLFIFMFLGAGAFNIATAISEPEAYLFYADLAMLDVYRNFIAGFFAEHTTTIVVTIAVGQLAIAGLLAGSGVVLVAGVSGGVIFFLSIAPLGAGSAFPSSLFLAAALILIARRSAAV